MNREMLEDPERDPRLAAALRDLDEVPPVDFAALQARVAAAAELPLAQRRGRRGPSRSALALRALVPLAAAAGIAGAYLALSPARRDLGDGERLLVEQMVEASLPETVDELLTGEAAQGALIEAVSGS